MLRCPPCTWFSGPVKCSHERLRTVAAYLLHLFLLPHSVSTAKELSFTVFQLKLPICSCFLLSECGIFIIARTFLNECWTRFFFPLCIFQKWINVGMTLEQVALGQLTAIYSQSQDNETNAHRLLLRGKYFRMLAVQEDPLYLCALWDRHKQVHNRSISSTYQTKCLLNIIFPTLWYGRFLWKYIQSTTFRLNQMNKLCVFLYVLHTDYNNTDSSTKVRTFWLVLTISKDRLRV